MLRSLWTLTSCVTFRLSLWLLSMLDKSFIDTVFLTLYSVCSCCCHTHTNTCTKPLLLFSSHKKVKFVAVCCCCCCCFAFIFLLLKFTILESKNITNNIKRPWQATKLFLVLCFLCEQQHFDNKKKTKLFTKIRFKIAFKKFTIFFSYFLNNSCHTGPCCYSLISTHSMVASRAVVLSSQQILSFLFF